MATNQQPPSPPLQNPIRGTTINTAASKLGLPPDTLPVSSVQPTSPSTTSHRRSQSVIKRVVERTAEKLSSHSLKRSGSTRLAFAVRKSQAAQGSSSSSLEDDGDGDPQLTRPSLVTSPPALSQSSPGIRPPSQSTEQPPRPSLHSLAQSHFNFRSRPPMDNSLRQGTQTLIQALQAIPWEQDDDDGLTPPPEDATSDEEAEFRMSSSIHTIHRSRETHFGPSYARSRTAVPPEDYFANHPSEDGDDTEEADFDDSTSASLPRLNVQNINEVDKSMLHSGARTPVASPATITDFDGSPSSVTRMPFNRMTSVATVRVQRRAQLAGKLREVFDIPEITEVVAELPCWLLRSVLLQGYMYLTNSHLCFFAHMPSREDQVLKSGTLSKKASRTKRWNKHWFVLKNDVLSWYQSSADPYFPHGNVDLRYAISCDAVDDKTFKLRTNQKTIMLAADSGPSREEWVKAIRRIIFKAQNMGESVKIAIPYSVIIDIDQSTAIDFSETIEVKVADRDEQYTMDSYFFAYFADLPEALEQMREVVRNQRQAIGAPGLTAAVSDTTIQRSSSRGSQLHAPKASTIPADPQSSSNTLAGFRLTSLLRPFADAPNLLRRSTAPNETGVEPTDDFTHVHNQGTRYSRTLSPPPVTLSSVPSSGSGSTITSAVTARPSSSSISPVSVASSVHTYPPSTPPLPPPTIETHPTDNNPSYRSSWTNWIKAPSRRLFSVSSSTSGGTSAGEHEHVSELGESCSEVLDSPTRMRHSISSSGHAPSATSDEVRESTDTGHQLGFSILEAPPDSSELAADTGVTEKFRKQFALDEKETLVGYLSGSLFRVLPVSGRMYISTNYFCFRSSQPLTRTRMMLPIRDILSTEKQKPFRFGHHGLVVIIRGHEELFFEFNSEDRRDSCMNLLERQMNEIRERHISGEQPQLSQGKREALILEELDSSSLEDSAEIRRPPESETAVMFTSSTFVNFKPTESLRFTFLTIGSRGDVQPYIALSKGLQADGHKVRIATHIEYKDWIEGHGIEYGHVGGDPAELMRICVENGTFTVSFLKEGLLKFRGWLDDLLKTSWEACQGSDVLIESPSAMGGLHIAEALRIPYFRAFTMPWTRTRAYPHAFAVPERKMGGGYNYMTYVMFDQVFWRATAGQINRWRRNLLGLESTNLDKMEPHKVPFLYNFSPSVVPPPLDWYEWIRVTGYWFLNDADDSNMKKWTPPPDLLEFIDNAHDQGKRVVYIGFGSIVVSDPEAMTKCVVEAIVQSGVHAILSKGWSDRLSTKKPAHPEGDNAELPVPPLPPQIYSLSSVPHDWLFPRIDAACHHGGAGTTGASLRAGIPTVIKPFFGDQFFWADRVEALGIGSSVRKLTVDSLTEALRSATTDQKQIDRAKQIGESIRAENGVAKAVEAIYRDLEYARSLIKRPANESKDHDAETDRAARNARSGSPLPTPRHSSSASGSGAMSSDGWSVISEENNSPRPTSSQRLPNADGVQSSPSKLSSRAATTFSALTDALSINRTSSRRSTSARREDAPNTR